MNKPYLPLGKGQFLNLSGRFLLLSSNIMKERAVKIRPESLSILYENLSAEEALCPFFLISS
jgi:hypothetical protein